MLHSSRTLRDWISGEGFPEEKLERKAVLPTDAGKQIHKRIVHLQVGFGVTRNHIRRFSFQIWKDQSVENDGKGLVCSLRRNPGLTLRKAENLNYGRLMKFSREIVYDFFKLLRQTMEATLTVWSREDLSWLTVLVMRSCCL
jgi:hypothetical protein